MINQQPLKPSLRSNRISFSGTWQLLGPFQIGTREATWGADPLEYVGGFHSLLYNERARYHSSLAINGTVGWSKLTVEQSYPSPQTAKADLLVRFDNTDWTSLQSVYGWAALQYQGWARGKFFVDGDEQKTLLLYTDQVLELWIDDEHHFGGDFYGYRRAPLVLHLNPGDHWVDIRIIRDVRVMGGIGEPTVSIGLEAEVSDGGLKLVGSSILLPDMVEGKLVSFLGSVNLRNEENHWIDVLSLESVNSCEAGFTVRMKDSPPFRLAPGQSRPLSFDIASSTAVAVEIAFEITYRFNHSSKVFRTRQVRHAVQSRGEREPQKITYLHPGGIVSYAILRPPSTAALRYVDPDVKLPVVLGLHGAGVETDGGLVRHTFDDAPDLKGWVLFPSGMTAWSGDDWHRWGTADTEAAITAILEWIRTVGWKGPSVNVNRRLVTGHSNGGRHPDQSRVTSCHLITVGQGTWYALTHSPDKIIGAAPVSGYSSIQGQWPNIISLLYLPFILTTDEHSNALVDYQHELLLENSCGIPLHQQHGSLDDNVPPFHSRRLCQIRSQVACPSEYVELPGKGHWFEGVMTTQTLLDFYDRGLKDSAKRNPPLPSFEFVIANPGTMGSKGGIEVDQLTSAGHTGRIKAEYDADASSWQLRTSNIHRLHFSAAAVHDWMKIELVIDGAKLELLQDVPLSLQWLVRKPDGSWQLGALDAILDTRNHFIILTPNELLPLAVQISRNLLQYFGADAEIIGSDQPNRTIGGNKIILSLGSAGQLLSPAGQVGSIIIDQEQGLCVRGIDGHLTVYGFKKGLGAIFLRPGTDGTLELVVWGFDSLGLRLSARMVPMLTGVGQPDFVIVSRECAWKGAAGVHALGFFDNSWNIAESSAVIL
ncbi:MAG: hypothetical protein Q9213_001026 [Squamulea squamosa]